MVGCLRRLGCLSVVVLAVGLYLSRDAWRGVAGRWIGRPGPTVAAVDATAWETLTPERAVRGERAVSALARRDGPVYVTLRPGELASYVFLSLASGLPASAQGAEATVIGDRVYVRTLVSLSDLGAADGALGVVGGFLRDRDTLQLGGTFDVVRPRLAQFHVRDLRLGAFPVPNPMIPSIVSRVRRGATPADVAGDALAVPIPAYIGDVRVARGLITLYRAGR